MILFIKKNFRHEAMLSACLLFICLACVQTDAASSQTPMGVLRNFFRPEYDDQGRLKGVIKGEQAVPAGNNLYNLKGLRIESYTAQGKTNWIVESPQCVFDGNTNIAFSDGTLNVRSADGGFNISGEGFEWRQADQQLQISNLVRTLITKVSKQEDSVTADLTKQDLEITSGLFLFNFPKGLVRYSKQVKVRDMLPAGSTNQPMNLDCEVLTIKLPTAGSGVDSIFAEQKVSFRQGANRASGEKAVYLSANETVELTGDSAWETDFAQGKGDVLVMDRKNDVFQAKGNTFTRLKPSKRGGGLIDANRQADTNAPIEITADNIRAELPGNLRTNINIFVDGHVAINRGEQKAQGDNASYTGSNVSGKMQISGNARWQIPDAEGRADVLLFDRARNAFAGNGNGYIKIMRRPANAGAGAEDGKMEVWARNYEYQDDRTRLSGEVRAEDAEWRLNCQEMVMQQDPISGKIKTVNARDGVQVEQKGLGGAARNLWKMSSTSAQMDMRADGRTIGSVKAEGNVMIDPIAPGAGGAVNLPFKIRCDQIGIVMAQSTNRIEKVSARDHIQIEQLTPTTGAKRATSWKLSCGVMDLDMNRDSGNMERVKVEKDVEMEMTQLPVGNRAASVWKLVSDKASLRMALNRDQEIEEAQAEDNVRVTQYVGGREIPSWTLQSQMAEIKMASSNRIERLGANRNVILEQGLTTNEPPVRLTSEKIAVFLNESNAVRLAEAEKDVVFTQGPNKATSDTAYYNADLNEVQLRGRPWLLMGDLKKARKSGGFQQLQIENADIMTWNRASNTFRAKGPFTITPKGLKLQNALPPKL